MKTRTTHARLTVKDEIYDWFASCLTCGYSQVLIEHRFCPNCGRAIKSIMAPFDARQRAKFLATVPITYSFKLNSDGEYIVEMEGTDE